MNCASSVHLCFYFSAISHAPLLKKLKGVALQADFMWGMHIDRIVGTLQKSSFSVLQNLRKLHSYLKKIFLDVSDHSVYQYFKA